MRAALVLILLSVGFYWKLALTDQYVWFDHPDMSYLEIPRLEFMAREIHKGRFPLWDPHIWIGQPLIGQTQPGPLNPLNLLFLLLPLQDGYLREDFLNWYFVLMHALAALGAYALCRELRRSRAASILGACAFSFGGFLGSVAWLDVMSGALWAPFICLFFVRAARGRRPLANAALSGVFLGVAWLSGHHEIPLLTTLALGVAWAILLLRRRRAALAPLCVTFLIAAMTGAAQLWPTWEFGRLSKRWGPAGPGPVGWNEKVSYLSAEMYSLPPRGLAGLLLPDQGAYGDSSGFLGVVGVLLASLAVYSLWRLAPVRWLTAAGGIAAVYALGAFTPLHGMLYGALPELHKARVPVRALHLVNFALAILAAYGADQLLRRRCWKAAAAGAKVAGALGAAILVAVTVGRLQLGDAMVLSGLVGLALCAIIPAWGAGRMRRSWLAGLVGFLMLAELHAVHTRAWQNRLAENGHRFARVLRQHRDIAAFLRNEPGQPRAAVNDQDVPVNFGDLHSVDMLEGYVAGVTANLLDYGRHTAWARRLYGVTHYIARSPDRPDLELAFEGEGGVKVFRVPGALPRARAVHQTVTVASPEWFAPVMDNPSFDAGRTVVLAGSAPELERCESGPVEILSYAPNRVRLRARMGCRGMVVLSDTYYPGWRVRVDGRETRIWAAYGSIRGVVVEKGSHEVEFYFRPVSVLGGMALTAAGLLAALLIAASKWRSVNWGARV